MRYLIFALGVIAAAAPAAAQETARPWPPFAVIDANGTAVESAVLAPTDRALVVYVKADCRSCDQLLGTLARVNSKSPLVGRLVLLIGADVEDAAALARRSLPPELRDATWYADRDGGAWAALGITGLPLLLGVQGDSIEWTMSGAQDRRLLESVVRSWIGNAGGQE